MNEALPELIQSDLVYRGRILNVSVDRVKYPDGRTVNMDVVRHPGSVVLLAMTAADRILLVRQYRYVVNRWLWELPAGTRESGESLLSAALRECHEEVGRIAERAEELASFFPSPGFCDEHMTFFRLTGLRSPRPNDPVAAQDPDEWLDVKEFSLDEVRAMILAGEIADMKTALGISLIPV